MESSSGKTQNLTQNLQWTQSHSGNVFPSSITDEKHVEPAQPELQIPLDPGPITWTDHNLYFLLDALQKDMSLSTLKLFCQEWFPHHSLDLVRSSLCEVLQNKLDNSSPNIQHGIAWMAVGIAVLSLPLSSNQHLLIFILSYLSIIWGTLKIIHGWMSKKRIQRLLHGLNQMPSTFVNASE